MHAGLAFLIVAYCLSQFFRAFLAVLSPVLQSELGATTADLSMASGLWFVCFALMQLPVGWALDTIGPRRTATVLFAVGAVGGSALFALAQGPNAVIIAMGLIGIGCAPILMSTYFIFARVFSLSVFGTLAGVTVGVSSLGNLASAAPLAAAVEAFGWRETLWATTAFTALIALGIALCVRDPKKPEGEGHGTFAELLRIRALWPILAMMFVCYAPMAGLRGLWIGEYFADIFGAPLSMIGTATLVMGVAMVVGNFVYGPIDKLTGTRKWAIFAGNGMVAVLCIAFALLPGFGLFTAMALFALIGFFGASYPAVIAHGRAFLPPHLTGRGVTLLNLFGMGGAGVMQFASGPAHGGLVSAYGSEAAYGILFAAIGGIILLGLAIYTFAADR